MRKTLLFASLALVPLWMTQFSNGAAAQSCASYTYNLTNGTTADATQVMGNFNAVRNCLNALQSGGTFSTPIFSGMTEAMRVLSNGYVGIGSTAPSKVLTVSGSPSSCSTIGACDVIRITDQATGGTAGAILEIGFNYATNAPRGNFATIGYITTDTTAFAKGDLFFTTRGVTTNSDPVERMRITSGGNVGIGTTTPAVQLQVVGDIRTGASGTNGCVQNFAGTALAGTCSSDERLKTITGKVTGVLDRLASLELIHFNWNAAAARIFNYSGNPTNTGFTAQSVQRVFPELVSTDAKGYKQLDYTTLQLYGLEAIKELKAANDNQMAEIERLHKEVAELRNQVELASAVMKSIGTVRAASFKANPR